MGSNTGLGVAFGRNNSSILVTDENEVASFRKFKIPNFSAFERNTFLAQAVHGSEGLQDLANDIFHAVSLLGKDYGDEDIQTNLKSLPFHILEEASKLKVVIQGKQLSPDEVLLKIVSGLKKHIDRCVVYIPKAIVTYPVGFNLEQQQSIEEACKDVGFHVLGLVDEHTATACNHIIPETEHSKVLLFDLSRRTFHVSLFRNLDPTNIPEIQRHTRGKENFGGDSFASTLLEFCLDELKLRKRLDLRRLHQNENLRKSQEGDLIHLRKQCEAAMITLSEDEVCEVSLPGKKHIIVVDRDQFNAVNAGNFEMCLSTVEQVLRETRSVKEEIEHVILDGKSCQMPRIKEMLEEYFGDEVQFYFNTQIDSAASFAANLAVAGVFIPAPSSATTVQAMMTTVRGLSVVDSKTAFKTQSVPLVMATLKKLNLNPGKTHEEVRPAPKPRPRREKPILEEQEPSFEIAENESPYGTVKQEDVDDFEALLVEQKSRDEILMEVVDAIYKENMDKAMATPEYVSPNVLQENHELAIQLSLKTLSKLTPLTQALIKSVKLVLEEAYTEYKDINKQKEFNKGPSIGIDLGTTFCCTAVYQDEKILIVPNDVDKLTTPSYVAFPDPSDDEDTEVIVGEQAKILACEQSQNAIFDVKRLIGRSPDDERIQSLKQYWPFQLFQEDRKVKIQVGKKLFFPEEIVTHLVRFIKQCAEDHFGVNVINAVVTVPAYFNDRQRSLTKESCKKAGLNVLQLLNEPTAAALAYSLHKKDDNPRHCLIFDLGGGTFDVAILHIKESKIHIKAIDGDAFLGGEDFDNEMVQHCIEECKRQNDIDLTQDGASAPNGDLVISKRLRRLKRECEKQKCLLSSLNCKRVNVNLDEICPNVDLSVTFTRDVFESLIEDKVQKCMDILDRSLDKAGLGNEDISEIVLVGGSSRIPRVHQALNDKFPGRALSKSINPDEAVASGAAILASFVDDPELPNISIQECDNTVWL